MFELLGSETEHEEAAKRIINLQEQIIQNYDSITKCYKEIKSLEDENEMLENALKHWKKELDEYYNCFSETMNLVVDLFDQKPKKPKTK